MWKRRLALLATALLLLLSALPTSAKQPSAPPLPVPLSGDVSINLAGGGNGDGIPGTLYVGAVPPSYDPTKPVLLFVHGLGGAASSWWGESSYHGTNDMYTYAYNNGYRTAFVDLYGDRNMWANGQMLAGLINQATSYYGVNKLVLIAHSKGGVDSNAAVEYYGASAKVSRVITLGSPHKGTPLADLAYSSWAGWMADIFGAQNEATYSMTTGYMNAYRSQTDPLGLHAGYYTLSGYKCGPVFSAYWYGCMAISGEDDGVVPVWSTRIPGGSHLKEGYWDHDEIKFGSRTWSWFSPVIGPGVGSLSTMTEPTVQTSKQERLNPAADAPGNQILRGDWVTGSTQIQAIPIEKGARAADFILYGSRPDLTATVTSPSGESFTVKLTQRTDKEEPLAGLWTGTVSVKQPAAGVWSVQVDTPEPAGFLLMTALDSPLQAKVELSRGVLQAGESQSVKLAVTGVGLQESRANGQVRAAGQSRGATFRSEGGAQVSDLIASGNGVQNLSLTLTGTTADGSSFERSIVTSFAVGNP
ncbi:MAG TPA: hypothetical protein VK191_11885 [Symbiobacteriaceae bacterium]|nr:hypothetical protein [Symbiobacteriaceae bacterium]